MQFNLIINQTRTQANKHAMPYLDVNNVTLPVDAHVCGQGNWACKVNATN